MTEFLARDFYGNSVQAWLTALGIAVAINLVVLLLKRALVERLRKVSDRSGTLFDDELIESLHRTKQWLVFFVALYVGSRYLELPPRANTAIRAAATLAFFFQIGIWIAAGVRLWIERSRKRALASNASAATGLAALGFILQTVLWAIVVMLALDNLGVDVTALVAGLGIGGIAVALAAQNILGDLFASISIIMDKPFVVGDFIVVDDYMGTVEYVGLKTTRLRSINGEQIIFSNGELLKARVRNYKRMYERRVVFAFGASYRSTADQLEKIPPMVRAIVESQKKVRFDRSHFASIGASSYDFETVYWVLDTDFNLHMDVLQNINLSLMRALDTAGVELSMPMQMLEIGKPLELKRVAPDQSNGAPL